jgi:hypothetical protein
MMKLELKVLARKILFFMFLFVVFLQSSCSNMQVKNEMKPINNALVLDYKDFGPSQLSKSLLGKNFWQWQDSRGHSPTQYDIKVVVYKNLTLEATQKNYPTIPEKNQDYRYVKYSKTVTWLDERILQNQQDLRISTQGGQLELILYDFSRLENMYKLLLNIERALK